MAKTAETAPPLAPKMPDIGVIDTIKKTRGEDEGKSMNDLQSVHRLALVFSASLLYGVQHPNIRHLWR